MRTLQSHDAEFAEIGEVVPKEKLPDLRLPVNEDCNKCGKRIKETDGWGRDETKLRVHFGCLPKFIDDHTLDAKWTDLIAEGDDTTVGLHAAYERAMNEAREKLGELRDYARMKLNEKPSHSNE